MTIHDRAKAQHDAHADKRHAIDLADTTNGAKREARRLRMIQPTNTARTQAIMCLDDAIAGSQGLAMTRHTAPLYPSELVEPADTRTGMIGTTADSLDMARYHRERAT